jgi:hypothetical protein
MTTARATGWAGWVQFAAVVLLISGLFGAIQGLVAIIAPEPYFVVSNGALFLLDLDGWGWWNLAIGILLVVTAAALFTNATWARVVAIILACLSAVGQVFLLPAQPWWSAIIIAVDVLVIYALTAHGRDDRSNA